MKTSSGYETYLIQRLKKPFPQPKTESTAGKLLRDNPFCFGGGLKNGGLSDKAMCILREIFSFDYMGAAEYEFGAVPEALSKMTEAKDLIAKELKVMAKPNDMDFRQQFGRKKGDKKVVLPKPGKRTVYCIASDELLSHAEGIIELCAKDGRPAGIIDFVGLQTSLFAKELVESGVYKDDFNLAVGWLELDNGFMFFTDHEMFRKCCVIFDIKEPVK
jgi:hypothetical protein